MTSYVTNLISQHAVLAVFAVMAVDAVLPVGGELTMLFAGAVAGGAIAGASVEVLGIHAPTGLLAFVVIVLVGTLGYLVGSLLGWALGRRGGRQLIARRGRWLHLGPERFARAERWFERFGLAAVFLGRLTPLVRSFISVPAGALGSPLPSYTALTSAGSLIWCVAFASVGWATGDQWEKLHHGLRYADYAILALALAAGAYVVVRYLTRAAR